MNKTEKFDLSVIIVTFNNEKTIKKCLNSLSQSISHLRTQLIIIDNKSTDRTREILFDQNIWNSHLFAKVEKLENKKNLGYTRAVNLGLKLCTGKILLLLNPDIILLNNTIPFLYSTLLAENRYGIVAPQLRYLNGQIQPSCRRFPRKIDVVYEFLGLAKMVPQSRIFNKWRMPDFDHRTSRNVDQPQGAFLLIKESVIKKIGYLDENLPMFFSDVDLCYRVITAGWEIWFCSMVFAYHVKGASVRQKWAEMIVSSHRSFVDYFAKYDTRNSDCVKTLLTKFMLLIATPIRLLLIKIRE